MFGRQIRYGPGNGIVEKADSIENRKMKLLVVAVVRIVVVVMVKQVVM